MAGFSLWITLTQIQLVGGDKYHHDTFLAWNLLLHRVSFIPAVANTEAKSDNM